MRILAIGPIWRGSNAGGLFKAFSRNGCVIDIIDEFYYLSLSSTETVSKVIHKIIRPLQVKEYNQAILRSLEMLNPDVFFVYKGAFVYPETIKAASRKGCKLVLFYPDVSMTTHGSYLPTAIPLYDIVFTTKTFGIRDLKNRFAVNNAQFIPHGFDPEIHRKLQIEPADQETFGCDVSFIGTYSAKKEKYLAALKTRLPQVDLKIWGNQWGKSTSAVLKNCLQNTAVSGDLYALAIQCSKINLGILHERVSGASSGDLITSRTFHIPASYGFLLHERNEESVLYYDENVDVAFFSDEEEMISQVEKYLKDEKLRNEVRKAGYSRVQRDHSLDARAAQIMQYLSK